MEIVEAGGGQGRTRVVDLSAPVSVATSLASSIISAVTFAEVYRRKPSVGLAAAAGAGAQMASQGVLNQVVTRYTPKGGQPNTVSVEEQYRRMWETRRKKYGPTGRKGF